MPRKLQSAEKAAPAAHAKKLLEGGRRAAAHRRMGGEEQGRVRPMGGSIEEGAVLPSPKRRSVTLAPGSAENSEGDSKWKRAKSIRVARTRSGSRGAALSGSWGDLTQAERALSRSSEGEVVPQVAAPYQARQKKPLSVRKAHMQTLAGRMVLKSWKRTKKAEEVDPAVLQAQGGIGNAQLIDDHPGAKHSVLLYRLVGGLVQSNDNPWGGGKLLELAQHHNDDHALKTACYMLLSRPWRQDPVRRVHVLNNRDDETMHVKERVCGLFRDLRCQSRTDMYGGKGKGSRPSAADTNGGDVQAGLERLRALQSLGKLGPKFNGAASSETWGTVLVHGRGTVGETALHLLFLLGTPQHRRLIRVLVPWLAKQKTRDADDETVCALDASYLGQPYNGEVALHFAVIQQDLDMVRLLVSNGANVNKHASGEFLYSHPALYFGGTVIGFAACLGNLSIVEYLVRHNADVNARDLGPALGERSKNLAGGVRNNSLLHCCVLHSKEEMYRYLTTVLKANPWAINDDFDTPLLLAASRRSLQMVRVAMDGMKQTLWTFGPVCCVRYPLYEIEYDMRRGDDDSMQEASMQRRGGLRMPFNPKNGGARQRRTVLQIIDVKHASELLYLDVIWKLLNDKWEHFAKRIFHWFVFLNVISLICLTLSLCSSVQGDTCNAVLLLLFIPVPLNDTPSWIGDMCCFANLAITMWLLLRRVVTQTRLNKSLWPDTVEITSCLLPWVAMPWRFSAETIGAHYVILGFASALGWLRFLQDSFKFSPQMGPLVLMVQKMVVQNVLPFMTMFCCFFLMTFCWLWGVYTGINNMNSYNLNETFPYSFDFDQGDSNIFKVEVWNIVTLLTRFTINPDTAYRVNPLAGSPLLEQFAVVVQWTWVVLSHIVLLNALIAMMNTTYSAVHEEQEAEWRLQFLEQVLFQEATPRKWFVPSFLGIRYKRPQDHMRGTLSVITPGGNQVEVTCWFVQLYRHGEDVRTGTPKVPSRMESEKGVSGRTSGALTDAQLEMRLKEFEQRMENHVNRSVTKALVGMTSKMERLIKQQGQQNKPQLEVVEASLVAQCSSLSA